MTQEQAVKTFKTFSDDLDPEAWEDGRFAGYHAKPKNNPFGRGWGEFHTPEQLKAATSWDDGYAFGDADYWRDLFHEKHKEDE